MGKMKVAGIVLTVLSLLGLISGIGLAFGVPYFMWYANAMDASDFDDWSTNPARYDGEVATFRGELDEKNSADIGGRTLYSYTFKGCDNGFLSSADIGDSGDTVLIQIRMVEVFEGSMGAEVHAQPRVMLCAAPGIGFAVFFLILLIVGLILLFLGVKKDKAPKEPTAEEKRQQAIAAQLLAEAQAQEKVVEERKFDYSSYGEAEYDERGRPKLASFSQSYTGQFNRQQAPGQHPVQPQAPRPQFDKADMDQFQATVQPGAAGQPGSSQEIETVTGQPAMEVVSSGPAFDESAPRLEFEESSSIRLDDMESAKPDDDIEIETVSLGMQEDNDPNKQLVSASGRFDNSPPGPQPGQVPQPQPGQVPQPQPGQVPQPQPGQVPQPQPGQPLQ